MMPTQRTLVYLREQGYMVGVVERWNQHARIRQDLFGFIDLIYLTPAGIVGVQVTSASNVSAHIKKIHEECWVAALGWLAAGGRIEVWGWKKYKKPLDRRYWRHTIKDITNEEDQPEEASAD